MSERRIAPRPTLEPRDSSTASPPAGGIDEPQSSLTQTQNTASATASNRKKVTSACQGCQKRRVKCDGNLPCATCIKSGIECVYTPDLDGRSIKRKFHEVQRDQDFLFDLIKTLKDSEDENVAQIVSIIRSGASMDEIRACVTQQMIDIRFAGRERSPEFKELQGNLDLLGSEAGGRARAIQRPDFLAIQRLADRPPYKVRASPWTTVTDDDHLVSNLINLWLTWDKGWLDWIDKDLFLRDMQLGSLDCLYCSPFLVNCLLAWGCPHSDFKEARTVNGAVSALSSQFIAEAERLLNDDSTDQKGLPTIQGLLFLHAAMAAAGKDQSGFRYMLEALDKTPALIRSPAEADLHPDPQVAKELSYAIDRTCWGIFNVTTFSLSCMLKPQALQPPRRARPVSKPKALAHEWVGYPQIDDSMPSHSDDLFHFGCDLAVLEAQLSQDLYNVETRPSRKDLETRIAALREDLNGKIRELPPQLDPQNIHFGCCPGIYAHCARIQSLILRMYTALRESSPEASTKVVKHAHVQCLEAALEIARISKVYMNSWGSSFMGMFMCQPITIGLSVLLEQPEISTYTTQITDLCVGLRAMSRRWPLCMGMMRMIQLDARVKGISLPPETDKLFEEFESSAWRQRELKRYFTLYPLAETSKSGNLTGQEVDMGRFLEAMEKLELDD